jgi:hypothetical protein
VTVGAAPLQLAVERMRKLVALPVLSADALSSVAYGPQAMLAVLVLAGLPGPACSLPVGGAIVLLMLAVGVPYRQPIRAYPQGGGSYIVATEELGRIPGLTAAAGLLIDYVMTVAVSIASGVAAITSAFPSLRPATVWVGVGVIVVLLAGNLRGVRKAGAVFAVPTYAFIVAIAALVIAGLVHSAARGFGPVPTHHLAVVESLSVLLVLRAFASGSTAMTGIEAISNAVPGLQAGRVAQRPDHADLDGRAAHRDVLRRAGDQQTRRSGAGGKPDDADSARPLQHRRRADVLLRPGSHRRRAAIGHRCRHRYRVRWATMPWTSRPAPASALRKAPESARNPNPISRIRGVSRRGNQLSARHP